jgi:hypothetical protein
MLSADHTVNGILGSSWQSDDALRLNPEPMGKQMALKKQFGDGSPQEDQECGWYLCIFHKREIERGKLPVWVIPAPSPIDQETAIGFGRLADLQLGLVSSSDMKKHFDPLKGSRHGGTHKGAITILSAIPEPPPWARESLNALKKNVPTDTKNHTPR